MPGMNSSGWDSGGETPGGGQRFSEGVERTTTSTYLFVALSSFESLYDYSSLLVPPFTPVSRAKKDVAIPAQ